jgi:glycosyltransferase involved in cell wall biosynthesis
MKINFIGQFHGPMGIPQHAREMVVALNKIGADVSAIQIFKNQESKVKLPKEVISSLKKKFHPDAPGVVFWYPDSYKGFDIFSKTFGYFIFEYTKIPKQFVSLINDSGLAGLCTASEWGKKVLIDNGVTIPVHVIPGGVNTDTFNTDNKILNSKIFSFLHIGKFENRKSTYETIVAFNQASMGDPRVRLTLSIDNPHISNFSAEEYVASVTKNLTGYGNNIDVIHFVSDITQLYKTHHCAVFPTKAEGIGLPIVEAMACGIPIITSHNTGITAYANDNNAILLKKSKEEDIYDPHFFPNKGEFGTWMAPDIDELAEKMMWVLDHKDEARIIGERAAKDMKENYTWEIAANKLLEIL